MTKHSIIRRFAAEGKKTLAIQTTNKNVASLTDADVIVFVNNTQLDAADRLRPRKAPLCTQRTEAPVAIEAPLVSQYFPPRRSRGDDTEWMLLP